MECAADILLGRIAPGETGAAELLRMLAAERPQRGPAAGAPQLARLLRGASRFARVFQIAAPEAPGLMTFGAEVDPTCITPWWGGGLAGVSGVGVTLGQAFASCVGEGLEYLSQFERADTRLDRLSCEAAATDPAVAALVRAILALRGLAADTSLDWVVGRRLSDDASVLLPADLCLRRDGARQILAPPGPLSIGCGAGVTAGHALLHGLLEIVERDAAALWWRGGFRPRAVPLEAVAVRDGSTLIAQLRQGLSRRTSHLLEITTDLGIPSVAAVSFAPDGTGFCCGTAARPTLNKACEAALLEMCQMELAYAVVQAKSLERGVAALNDVDRRHLRRFEGINAAHCALVHPLPCSGPVACLSDVTWQTIVRRLADAGFETFAVELTHADFEVPAFRVFCPGLQQEPSDYVTPRLAAAIGRTGGNCLPDTLPLM
jgi:ribosomal protein S12 methylthiotransferase accessory factor